MGWEGETAQYYIGSILDHIGGGNVSEDRVTVSKEVHSSSSQPPSILHIKP